jgi:hypothetical protein
MTNQFPDANRQGVLMLQNGDYNGALISFHRAFTGVKESVINEAGPAKRRLQDCGHPFSTQPAEGTEDERIIRVESETFISCVALSDNESAERENASPGNPFSVYNHAFIFWDTIFNRTVRQSHSVFITQSTVILFNTALTYQRKGLLGGPHSSKHLRKALQLYSMATDLFLNNFVFDNIFVIQLATLNNSGHIHCHFCEEEKASQCRSYLYHSLFEDTTSTSHILGGSPYAIFYLYMVGLEVRRRGLGFGEDQEE